MLVFPQWRMDMPMGGCRAQRWMPAERFAPYVARTSVIQPTPIQIEDDDSSVDSSPDRFETRSTEAETSCNWRGCGERFNNVARLSAHVARIHAHAHSDGLFYCGWRDCARPDKGFNARYKMLVHVRTHTNERPHVCVQCNKSFSRAENLKIHARSHSGEKPYICPYEGCGKAYSNSSDRFKHTRTHTVDKPYCCKVPGCNKRYTDPSSLRKHVKTFKHSNIEEPPSPHSSPSYKTDSNNPCNFNSTPLMPTYRPLEPLSPMQARIMYSPPRTMSYQPITPEPIRPMEYQPIESLTYLRPESMYPIRVPHQEMSYLEYTQMYDHAYRNYYTGYPVFSEKVFTFEEQTRIEDVHMEEREVSDYRMGSLEEVPLNLKCTRLECKPIEQLVRTDLPLDLSTKS